MGFSDIFAVVSNGKIGYQADMAVVRFTQVQAREILNLPEETVRHWRKVLPPLAKRPRRTPLSHGDLVALAAIHQVVQGFAIRVSALVAVADDIFGFCNSRSWPALAACYLEIAESHAALKSIGSTPALKAGAVILIPLAPLIDELGQGLLGVGQDQSELRFPPTLQHGGKR